MIDYMNNTPAKVVFGADVSQIMQGIVFTKEAKEEIARTL
jgi:hypothetical protein